MLKISYNYLAFVILLNFSLFSDIKSTTGVLKFDVDNDGTSEMVLNSNGLGLGQSSPDSDLDVNGSLAFNFELVSANVTLSENTFVLVDSSSENIILNLPDASTVSGRTYMIKKKSSENRVWIDSDQAIDGEDAQYLLEGSGKRGNPFAWFYSDGSEWHVVNQSDESDWVIASDNLVAWWRLDETNGSEAEDVGLDNYKASLQGGFSFSGCTLTGVDGRSLSFDGINDYATMPSDLNSKIDEELTISVWVNAAGSSFDESFEAFATEEFSGDGIVRFALAGRHQGGSSTKVGAGFYDGSWHVVNQSGTFSFGEWVHVAATYDGVTIKLFIDGSLENSKADAAGLPNGVEDWRIGRRHDSADYFRGEIDDLRIYNKALSEDQIAVLYSQHR